MGPRARTLGLLITLSAACVINTRPHLPLEDDGGRAAPTADVSAAFDGGFVAGAAGDLGVVGDSAPPVATPDAAAEGDANNGFELDSCHPADSDLGDGGADAGDARARADGGDAGFIDSKGRPCVPMPRRDASVQDGADARSGS